ncbi:uncharacterized protein [Miscanthus floridulus]|uniref:uncharacterized protein isoform X2 n=1 Tax=Miscanthus floridulus TaxID=154761 RepID=UPI003458618F
MAAAAEVREAGMVALLIGYGCAEILKPLFSFLEGAPARGPVFDTAVLFVVLTVVMAYLAGVVLLYLHATPASAAGTRLVLAVFRQYVLLVCALLVLFLVVAFFFPAAGGCCHLPSK